MALDDVSTQADTAVARTKTNTISPPYIPARILWPALGFPEIVDPSGAPADDDPTACIHVLLIAAADKLLASGVARHLRWAPWQQRRTRFFHPGDHSFPLEQIKVTPAKFDTNESDLTYKVSLAAGKIAVALAKKVWEIYKNIWTESIGLYEVTISKAAASTLPPGLWNLFWINRNPDDTESQPSQEMHCLLEKFVKPRLAKEFPREKWAGVPASVPYKDSDEMAVDYEFEWAPPQQTRGPTAGRRVEVLHPLFVGTAGPVADHLQIAHITDIHIGIREDVFEDRGRLPLMPDVEDISKTPQDDDRLLRDVEKRVNEKPWKMYNNPNHRFTEIYQRAKEACDVLLLTGDLIDFGRGHVGDVNAALGLLGNYWLDRNWFRFYQLLASGGLYSKPVYTSLGNHDWRLNPYPPIGAFFKTHLNYNLSEKELKLIHGDGAEQGVYNRSGADYISALVDWAVAEDEKDSMPDSSMPLVTTVQSVIWYLLLINPFLDYSVRLPSGYALLMLDWGRDEQVIGVFPGFNLDKKYWGLIEIGDPVAGRSLSLDQLLLVDHFVAQPVIAKILGIHAPLIGPANSWSTDDLMRGWVRTKDSDYFPVIAIPDNKVAETPFPPGNQPVHGTIKYFRIDLLHKLRDNKVSVVLAGHLHRPAIFVIVNPQKAKPDEKFRNGMALYLSESGLQTSWYTDHGPPLFVNTTSAGPIGHNVSFSHAPEERVPPGYSEITLAKDGRVIEVKERYGNYSPWKNHDYKLPPGYRRASR